MIWLIVSLCVNNAIANQNSIPLLARDGSASVCLYLPSAPFGTCFFDNNGVALINYKRIPTTFGCDPIVEPRPCPVTCKTSNWSPCLNPTDSSTLTVLAQEEPSAASLCPPSNTKFTKQCLGVDCQFNIVQGICNPDGFATSANVTVAQTGNGNCYTPEPNTKIPCAVDCVLELPLPPLGPCDYDTKLRTRNKARVLSMPLNGGTCNFQETESCVPQVGGFTYVGCLANNASWTVKRQLNKGPVDGGADALKKCNQVALTNNATIFGLYQNTCHIGNNTNPDVSNPDSLRKHQYYSDCYYPCGEDTKTASPILEPQCAKYNLRLGLFPISTYRVSSTLVPEPITSSLGYKYMGCYQRYYSRAGGYGFTLLGNVGSKSDALSFHKCNEIATRRNYAYIALNGANCFGIDKPIYDQKYIYAEGGSGRETGCKSALNFPYNDIDGVGSANVTNAKNAAAVYELSTTAPIFTQTLSRSGLSYLGCFNYKVKSVLIDKIAGDKSDLVCNQLAIMKKYKYFALNGPNCYGSNHDYFLSNSVNETLCYNEYATTSQTSPSESSDPYFGVGEGYAVYQVNESLGSLSYIAGTGFSISSESSYSRSSSSSSSSSSRSSHTSETKYQASTSSESRYQATRL